MRNILTVCLVAFIVGGCQAAALVDKFQDSREPAKYVPEQVTMTVLIEDYHNPGVLEAVSDHMERLVIEELIANKAAPIINPDRLTTLKSDHAAEYKKLSIPRIGLKVGARQILYADVTDFRVDGATGTDAMKGHAEARVKIVDCVTGETRWPRDGTTEGYPVSVEIPFAEVSTNVNETAVRDALARNLSSKIARLFYNGAIDQPDPAPKYPETDLQ